MAEYNAVHDQYRRSAGMPKRWRSSPGNRLFRLDSLPTQANCIYMQSSWATCLFGISSPSNRCQRLVERRWTSLPACASRRRWPRLSGARTRSARPSQRSSLPTGQSWTPNCPAVAGRAGPSRSLPRSATAREHRRLAATGPKQLGSAVGHHRRPRAAVLRAPIGRVNDDRLHVSGRRRFVRLVAIEKRRVGLDPPSPKGHGSMGLEPIRRARHREL